MPDNTYSIPIVKTEKSIYAYRLERGECLLEPKNRTRNSQSYGRTQPTKCSALLIVLNHKFAMTVTAAQLPRKLAWLLSKIHSHVLVLIVLRMRMQNQHPFSRNVPSCWFLAAGQSPPRCNAVLAKSSEPATLEKVL